MDYDKVDLLSSLLSILIDYPEEEDLRGVVIKELKKEIKEGEK